MTTLSKVDLTSCDREPIHVPGSTQSRGVLFACDAAWRITHVASGAQTFFPLARQATLLGAPLRNALGAALFRQLEEGLARPTDGLTIPCRVFGAKGKGFLGAVNVAAHEHGGRRVVELEPAGDETPTAPLDLVRIILTRLQQSRTLHELCDETARQVRALIGFDRVMIYRFLHDGVGQVIAEARRSDLAPLLNLRYPASDVPVQARELYKKNWVRLIDDVDARAVPILALPDHPEPLDLSYADLRAVSPIHIEYLKNMGVAASMSISIIVGGELWGLIACHHGAARVVGANVRAAAELLGQVFSLQIQTVESIEAYVTMRAGRMLLDRVISEFPVEGDLIDNLSGRLDQLAAFMPADGVGILVDGTLRGTGAHPTRDETVALADFLDRAHTASVHATHHLAADFEAAATWRCGVCGVLAVPLSHEPGNWLFFFRRAVVQTLEWGGDPSKAKVAAADGKISPRKSFEVWKAEVRGQSLPWTSRERLIGDTLRVYLLDIIVRFSDVIREERRQAEQRQRLLTSDLNHRVRGTLDLIQSLVVHGYEEPGKVQEFVRALEGRIKAIALAHDATSVTAGSELRTLVERALALYSPLQNAIQIQGPDVKLDAKAYTVLALVVHELITNATQHGALSTPGGRLAVSWFVDASARLVFFWEESGGPPPRAQRDGLGLAIIKRNIPHALGGEADFRLPETGVKASFVIPARSIAGAAPALASPPQKRAQLASPPRPLEGYSILVVEDQIPAAVDLERMLQERGAAQVRIVGTIEGAMAALDDDPPDVVVLDVDLAEGPSFAVADALAERSIPFVLAAGEIERGMIPGNHREVHVVPKPYVADVVVEILKEALLPHLIRAVLTRLV